MCAESNLQLHGRFVLPELRVGARQSYLCRTELGIWELLSTLVSTGCILFLSKYSLFSAKKDLHDQDNHERVITHLVPDILEWEVKWALESITTNKVTGGDVIPV